MGNGRQQSAGRTTLTRRENRQHQGGNIIEPKPTKERRHAGPQRGANS